MRSVSAQRGAATCHSQRARAVPSATERRPTHVANSGFAALPLPRHAASAAADLATTHTALRGSDLPIEGARTHAPTISMGASPVFLRFSALSLPADHPRRAHPCVSVTRFSVFHFSSCFQTTSIYRLKWAALLMPRRRLLPVASSGSARREESSGSRFEPASFLMF